MNYIVSDKEKNVRSSPLVNTENHRSLAIVVIELTSLIVFDGKAIDLLEICSHQLL